MLKHGLEKIIKTRSWTELRLAAVENAKAVEELIEGKEFVSTSLGVTLAKPKVEDHAPGFGFLSRVIATKEPMCRTLGLSAHEFETNICFNLLMKSKYEQFSLIAKSGSQVNGFYVGIDLANLKSDPPSDSSQADF